MQWELLVDKQEMGDSAGLNGKLGFACVMSAWGFE